MNRRWKLIETPAQLAKAEAAIRSAREIAVDTEYDSFRYFRDRLCLIQVQTGEKTWLIDPLAGLDFAFLGEVLNDPAVRKILHAGDNDIRILKRDYGFAFRNIFDTHRAASLLGIRQLALGKLLETYLGVTLEKNLQRSRWDLRPLREEQLDYAALDTVHLPELTQRLDRELREKGLREGGRAGLCRDDRRRLAAENPGPSRAPEASGIRDADRRAEGAPPETLPLAIRKGAGDRSGDVHDRPRSAPRRPGTAGAGLP